jgi:molecular chaperone GrpE
MADMKKGTQTSGETGSEAGGKEAMKREDMKEESRKTEAHTADTDTASEKTARPETGSHKAEAGDQNDAGTEKNGTADAEEKQDGAEQSDSGKNKEEAKSSGFGKKVKKDKKDEKIEELTDRLQRQMAEFDNFRKRTDREKSEMFDMGARDVIEKILPVVDNFERGLAGADESDPFVQGMNKIYKQMTKILTDMGVETIEAEGAEFDPNLHNAVMHEDNPDVGENIITQELQKGYKYKDVVVRHSMVKVAN